MKDKVKRIRITQNILVFWFISCFFTLSAQEAHPGKERRQEERMQRRLEFKQSKEQTYINVTPMYAFLSTTVTFELAGGILNAKLGLEKNVGLADRQFFFSGSALHRFTPRSGIYAEYYGIGRSRSIASDRDLIFLKDTIPAGATINSYFRTKVLSVGYSYTLLENAGSFLAGYFNVYLMDVSTGIQSEALHFDEEVGITAPIPAFGVVGLFTLTPWLYLDANVGYFSLNTPNFGGRVNNLDVRFNFKPLRWMAISAGYQEFDVKVYFPEGDVDIVVEYRFIGPTLGLSFIF